MQTNILFLIVKGFVLTCLKFILAKCLYRKEFKKNFLTLFFVLLISHHKCDGERGKLTGLYCSDIYRVFFVVCENVMCVDVSHYKDYSSIL